MTNDILSKSIQNELERKNWKIVSSMEIPEGYHAAITRKHISKEALNEDQTYSTTLLIKKRSEFFSYVKFQIHNSDKQLFSETEDLAIEVIDERILSVADVLFKKNTKKLIKEGILPKRFFGFFDKSY